MQRLLELESVSATEVWTRMAHGRVFHLEAGAGAPVVMLQGAGGGAANWYRLLMPLARGRRVLAPELPGFGLSDGIEPRAPLGTQAADVISDWLDVQLPDATVDVVATSFGGLVALHLARRRPGRIGRIVLLNACGLGRGLAAPVRVAGLPIVCRFVKRPSRAGTARLFRSLLTADRSRIPAEHADAIVEYTWRSALSGAGAELAKALPRFAGPRGQRELLPRPELAAIDIPVLILWGSADRFLPPRHGPRAAATLPRASFHLLDGVGHSPNWEAPDAVLSRMLPFLGFA